MLGSSHSQQENDGSKPPDNVHEEDGYASRLPVYKRSESDMSSTSEASEVSLAGAEKVDRDLGKVSGGATKAARSQSQGGRGSNGSKRARTLLTPEQSRVLHELLQQTCFPSTQVREAVAAKLGLSPRKVQVFFQNKRQKQRKKSNGVPMSSHPLVVPMYPPNITSERLVDGPSASTKMGPPRLSPPAHPVAEPSAANVRERTTPMTTTAFNVRKPPLGPTVDPWVNNWHVRPTNTERRTHCFSARLVMTPTSPPLDLIPSRTVFTGIRLQHLRIHIRRLGNQYLRKKTQRQARRSCPLSLRGMSQSLLSCNCLASTN